MWLKLTLRIFWGWLKKAGFSSLIYASLFASTLSFGDDVLGIVRLDFLESYVAGGFVGIFIYLNWNVIRKLWKKEKLKI